MLLKPLKKKLKRDGLQGITDTIKMLIQKPVIDDDDKLHFAVLAEIARNGEKKLLDVRTDYTITFSPAQALALRLLATDYMPDARTKHVGNIVHQIADEALKLYA
jgi:hypothetical protein